MLRWFAVSGGMKTLTMGVRELGQMKPVYWEGNATLVVQRPVVDP